MVFGLLVFAVGGLTLKRSIPRVVVLLSLVVFARLVSAQEIPNPDSTNKAAAISQSLTLPELVHRVKPSVVSILTYDLKGEPLISGSGFFVRPGEVMTNMHVIKGAHRVEIHTLEGKGRTYPVAGALAVDDEADLALLSVDLPPERSRPLHFSEKSPGACEKVFVL